MSLPVPHTNVLPLPKPGAVEPLFPSEEPTYLCAGPLRPDGAWTRRADGKRVEVYVHRIGRRAELRWTLDGQWMRPSDHSSEAWARDEMERWRRNDTMTAVQLKAGMEITLESGGTVRLVQFTMSPVWRTKQARRSWVVEKVRGFRATQKKRFTVAESEIRAAMQKQAEPDLMAILKRALDPDPKPAA